MFLCPIILLRLSSGTPSLRKRVANVCRAKWNVTFLLSRQVINCDILLRLSLQTLLEGTGNTSPFWERPSYLLIIIFGISNSITLDDVAVFPENSNQENNGNIQKNTSVINEVGKAIEQFLKPTYTANSEDELLKKKKRKSR